MQSRVCHQSVIGADFGLFSALMLSTALFKQLEAVGGHVEV